ncbi:SLATT domain-containing protein [Marinilabiliaceae bacterium JC017]|nr:SLATT domain-containing protein [Marinilabiliaceae bacterium JC017]
MKVKLIHKATKFFKKRKRAKNIKAIQNSIPPYLKKAFDVELNYKLWITKGARFAASQRTSKMHQLSSTTVGVLSAYLIIFNMLNVYRIPLYTQIPDNYMAFITTALSILILIFSQFESAKNYNIKSEKHHLCAMEIGELYNKVRMVKTFKLHKNETEEKIKSISREYDLILKKYENHDPIDVKRFQKTKSKYFRKSKLGCIMINVEYYILTQLKYHLFKYGPIIGLVSYQVYHFIQKT